ncbi:MAG: PIN domain-containing protein [Planctomycetales bacterium]|nr:PIN domain-containing protein [Planctomycetales bacterium]
MERVVVDTDVVSFYAKGDSRFASYAPELDGKQLVMSFMSLSELLLWQKLRNWGQARRDRFMQEIEKQYVIYPVDRRLCDCWARLKAESSAKGRVLETADAWIAATAVQLGIPLVTHNARDYQFLSNLSVISFAPQ